MYKARLLCARYKRRGFPRGVASGLPSLATAALLVSSITIACLKERSYDNSTSEGGNLKTSPGTDKGGRSNKASDRATPPPRASSSSTLRPSERPPEGAPLSIHLTMGIPVDSDPSDDYLMVKPQYALSYNRTRNVPNWVSWNLNASYFGSTPRKKGRFLSDESLPLGFYRARDQDYAGSGYDRGHLVRSEERTKTPEDNAATFFLTNVLPQRHELNAGPWLRLEEYYQALAQKENKELFIMAGGIFGKRPETIGKGIAVPTSCFKIVVVLERNQALRDVTESSRLIAVIMPNTTNIFDRPWDPYRTTVDEIEQRTGYDFLSAVPEPIQRVVEARTDSGSTGF